MEGAESPQTWRARHMREGRITGEQQEKRTLQRRRRSLHTNTFRRANAVRSSHQIGENVSRTQGATMKSVRRLVIGVVACALVSAGCGGGSKTKNTSAVQSSTTTLGEPAAGQASVGAQPADGVTTSTSTPVVPRATVT